MNNDNTCRFPSCDEPRRERGELEYPDSDSTASNGEPYRVSLFGAKFCSIYHELKFEKLRDEAREIRYEEQEAERDEW